MKGQLTSRVSRRAVPAYSAPQPSRRKWIIPVTLGVLLAIVVVFGATLASRGNYIYGLNTTSDAAYPADIAAMKVLPPTTGEDRIRGAGFQAYSYIPGSDVATQGWDRMIIRTATVDLTVKDVTTAIERVKAITAQQRGYVFSSESHEQGEYTYATVTIYVPAKEFDQIMPILRGLDGQVEKVTSESVTSSDVTEEYTDLQSQLRNLKATEARMLDLQTRATELEDVLAVDRELRTVQGEIEQIQGRINYLDKRTDMSTVTLQLSPVAAPPLKPESNWQPFEAASKAWEASLQMLANTVTAIITVGVFLWWLVPFALIGVWVVMRARKRSTVVQAEG